MTIKLLRAEDTPALQAYLTPYQSECMFICSNLNAAGIEYNGESYQGEYFGSYDNLGQINCMIVHYWNGNIIVHASDDEALKQIATHFKNSVTRPVAGILGPNTQVSSVIEALGLSNAHFTVNRNEGLYEIDLDTVSAPNIPSDFDVILAQEMPKALLIEWMKSYDIEALGAADDSNLTKQVEEHWNLRLQKNDSWVLRLNGMPISLSAFNARLEEMVQVGPVWTPPEYRSKGYASMLLAYTLIQERKRGVKKAILFTDHPAAIKVYLAIGFQKIGDYRMALLQKPITLSSKPITLESYNPNWPRVFEEEDKFIKQALGHNYIALHHVGSTSVEGLAAKPRIDAILVVKNYPDSIKSIEAAGFEYRSEYNIPMRYFFRKRGVIDMNLHVYEDGHPEIELNLMFRDYLRKHEDVRDEYACLKHKIAADESTADRSETGFKIYTLHKGDFIREVLKKAGFNRIRILKCNDETEWKAAKHFRDKYFFGPYGIYDPYTWTFNHNEHAHLVLYQGVDIIGYAHIQFWKDARAAIRIIVIDEDKRSKSTGSQFLKLIDKWLKTLEVKSIHAESRQSSLDFYIKNGYIEMPFEDPEGHESGPKDVSVGKGL